MTASRQHPSPTGQTVAFPLNALQSSAGINNYTDQPGPEASPIRPFRVLVVDDDLYLRQPIVMMLKRRNMEVSEAENGRKATLMIMAGNFDLVISDINMPEMDGMALLQWIKKNRPAIEVIMMSGEAGEEVILKAVRAGAADFLSKPFTSEDLKQAVDRCRTGLYSQPGQRQAINFVKQSMHDVRGGLVNVAGMMHLLQKKIRVSVPDSEEKLFAALHMQIQKSINQAEEYAAQALALAQGAELNDELLNLQSDIIDPVLKDLIFEIDRKQVAVNNQSSADRRLPLVRANSVVVKSILRNLFDNAIKYSPEHGAILYSIINNGPSYQVVVENDSVVFPATQSSIETKSASKTNGPEAAGKRSGLGQGLNMASFFAGRCGGEIWKEPRPAGARFVFSLPVATRGPDEKRYVKEIGK